MTYAEILAELRTFETTKFRNEPDAQEQLMTQTYDAVVQLLQKLVEDERKAQATVPPFEYPAVWPTLL